MSSDPAFDDLDSFETKLFSRTRAKTSIVRNKALFFSNQGQQCALSPREKPQIIFRGGQRLERS